VCLVNFGPLVGKLVVIVNVVDGKRVLVDGPSTVNGVPRQIMPLARLSLTIIKIDIEPGSRLPTLMKAYKAADGEPLTFSSQLGIAETIERVTGFQPCAVRDSVDFGKW